MMLGELAERECAYVSRYPPCYVSSIGCHLLNIANKDKKFYYHSGRLFDFRSHPFMIAPPGFSKTFWLDHFLDEDCGLISHTSIKTGFEGYMTEAGWVGQIRMENGEPKTMYGAAHEFKNGIIGVEEFAAIVEAMKTSHSRQLDVSMLTSLDRGRVRKRVGPGALPYETRVTLWAGTQTMRLDLASGMGRRLLFMVFFPSEKDKEKLREIYLKGHNIRFNPFKVRAVREGIERKVKQVDKLEQVNFSEEVKEFFRHKKIIHYEIPLYERLLVGYLVMSKDLDSRELTVTFDTESLRLVNQEIFWREQIKKGGQIAQVLMILKEHGDVMPINDLRMALVDLAFDWSQSSELLQNMARGRIIRIDSKGIVHSKG